MKNRFTTLDIVSIVPELNQLLKGYRVHQIYDVDQKTYLIRLKDNPSDDKAEINKLVLLIESGIRIHTSEYDWPKNTNVSGFTLKLRKHLKNKRIEYIKQVGIDRVVDIQFGINEAAYHIIIELYDRGNVIITDHQYVILNLLRSRKPGEKGENDDVKVMVREHYPLHTAVQSYKLPTQDEIRSLIDAASPGDTLRKIFNPRVIFGTALLEHCFIHVGFVENWKIDKTKQVDVSKVEEALKMAARILDNIVTDHNGIIVHKEALSQVNAEKGPKTVITYTEFHPMLFKQHEMSTNLKYIEFETFCRAVDIYFSSIEGQKIDQRALQQEKDALKKLENVKKDHEKRLQELAKLQEADKRKASLIEMNQDLVEKALLILRSAIANQISWEEIKGLIKEAQLRDDVVACSIKDLKLKKNQFTMQLSDPFEEEGDKTSDLVDIDLDLSAFGNARRYYDQKRYAAKKEQKTLESSSKALKSAEFRTQQTLKEVAIKTSITKARKILWFEKFFWFISSENYLVIGGRDAQQNELIVKKYLKQGDIYVHADLHGASSVVIKNYNPSEPISPKTLQEAGIMAVCYSSAWENKFSSRSWWVNANQVSKTAPSGEYLTVGAFMIRGKKNYLPMAQLVMGFGFLFRLDEDSIESHKSERKIKQSNEIDESIQDSSKEEEIEIQIKDSDDENENDDGEGKFPDVKIKNITETNPNEEDEPVEITGSQVPRVKYQQPLKKRAETKKATQKQVEQQKCLDKEKNKNQPLKRGQKYKLKKIKEKYKDQDEADKHFRMGLIGSSPFNRKTEAPIETTNEKCDERLQPLVESDLKIESEKETGEVCDMPEKAKEVAKVIPVSEKKIIQVKTLDESGEEEEDDDDDDDHLDEEGEGSSNRMMEHINLMNSLSGQPFPEDTLLYTIPVVAPYSALSNYKFKVKVLPGTNKRGKAAKTALHLFLNDKSITQREKDLLKTSKDQDIARNLPNKVKISAVNLSALKRKGK